MTVLQIVTVVVGLLIIAVRGPLIFAPAATRGVYLQLLATPTRVRGLASFLGLLGLVMVAAARGGHDVAAVVITVLGWIMLGGGVFLMVLPGLYREIAETMLEAVNHPTALRAIGVLGVGIGVILVLLGLPGG